MALKPPEGVDGVRRDVAPIVIASYLVFMYTFFSSYLLYMKRTMRIAVNTLIAASLNVWMNILLIPRYKAVGAAMATVIAYTVLFILHLIAILKEGKQFFNFKCMWINIASIIVFGIIFYLVKDIWVLRYMAFILFALVIYLISGRKMIKEFIGGIR